MCNPIVGLFEESGMSVREFATRADLKYSTAHDIVTGKANPENIGAGAFVRIAKTLGTTADALYSGIEETPADEGETELVDLYYSMDAHGREQLLVFARGCAASYPLNKADLLEA